MYGRRVKQGVKEKKKTQAPTITSLQSHPTLLFEPKSSNGPPIMALNFHNWLSAGDEKGGLEPMRGTDSFLCVSRLKSGVSGQNFTIWIAQPC